MSEYDELKTSLFIYIYDVSYLHSEVWLCEVDKCFQVDGIFVKFS